VALISATTSYSCPGVGTFTNVLIGGLTGFIAGWSSVLVAIIITFTAPPAGVCVVQHYYVAKLAWNCRGPL